ncbi:hypothetical protein N0V88_000653 [Collariella sp. IMI 366227]|nr:hypothetical protein N0V88_000653 [Collariella sp. IMI 366227]
MPPAPVTPQSIRVARGNRALARFVSTDWLERSMTGAVNTTAAKLAVEHFNLAWPVAPIAHPPVITPSQTFAKTQLGNRHRNRNLHDISITHRHPLDHVAIVEPRRRHRTTAAARLPQPTTVHEQEAFESKCSLVGLQEQLNQAHEQTKMLEQELAAIKTLAKSEAAVKRLTQTDGDNSGPRKRQRTDDTDPETLTTLLQWEKQRADRALEQVQFLETECQLKICSAAKALRRASADRKRHSILKMADPSDPMILSESRRTSLEPSSRPTPRRSKTDMLRADKEPRRSTIFLAAEGIFRTVSQAEADAHAAKSRTTSSAPSPTEPNMPITPTDSDPMYRRTPSVDP